MKRHIWVCSVDKPTVHFVMPRFSQGMYLKPVCVLKFILQLGQVNSGFAPLLVAIARATKELLEYSTYGQY